MIGIIHEILNLLIEYIFYVVKVNKDRLPNHNYWIRRCKDFSIYNETFKKKVGY